MPYTQLTDKEKYAIEIYLNEGFNYSEIGIKINRPCSIISRQVDKYIYIAIFKEIPFGIKIESRELSGIMSFLFKEAYS